jgi:glycosyltransferase involved in cell wall biosynthesis
MTHVLVLMPVYNGERFLPEQIESILTQSHTALTLICRDDGSTDKSSSILAQYAARYPDRVQVINDAVGNLGASGSFSYLMQWALAHMQTYGSAVYVALADQDDIWHLDKLHQSLLAMHTAEKSASGASPVLVHSDLRVVDADAKEISPSLMQYQGLDPARTRFSAQLISNTVTGCTSLMNRALLEKALPVPAQAVMHDWWLSLVASAFGQLVFVPRALVEYRQHGRNTLGARRHQQAAINWRTLSRLFQFKKSPAAQALFQQAAAQAAVFEQRFGSELDQSARSVIAQVITLPSLNLWQQRWRFRRLRSAAST